MSPIRPFTPSDLYEMGLPGDVQLSPCGTKVAFTVRVIDREKNRYASSIWVYDLKIGKARQFTNGRNAEFQARDHSPRWSPDGSMLAFLSDRAGKDQIFLIPVHGGEARQLTHGEPVSGIVFSPSGGEIAFVSREPAGPNPEKSVDFRVINTFKYRFNGSGYLDGRPSHIFTVQVQDGSVRQVTHGEYNSSAPMWSPSGHEISFLSYRDEDWEYVSLDDLWLVGAVGGTPRKITNSDMSISQYCWSRTGDAFFIAGRLMPFLPGSTVSMWKLACATAKPERLAPGFDRSHGNAIGTDQQSPPGFSGPVQLEDGSLVYVASDGGSSGLYRLCAGDTVPRNCTENHVSVCLSFSITPDGSRLALVGAGPGTLPEVYVGDPVSLTRVTRCNDALLEGRHVSLPEQVHFAAKDGTILEGWIMKPIGFTEGSRYPLVMQIHGGPHAAYGNAFFHEFQCLVGAGFGVFFMNPRGSVGYGESFALSITRDWCGIDQSDLLDGARFAARIDWVDSSRCGVTGGSQGGYFTNWLVGHTDMFQAAVTQRSMSNLYSKYGTADNGVTHDKASMGGADLWTDEDLIMERSPIRYAPNVTTPILILHSEEDYRCPIEQAEQWYAALKRLGKAPVEFVRFMGENHDLSRSGKPSNRVERLKRIIGWFEKYLTTRG